MNLKIIKYILLVGILALFQAGCSGGNADTYTKQEVPTTETGLSVISESLKDGALSEPEIKEVDLSSYFGAYAGSAVFYSPAGSVYEVYNLEGARERRSPCSTFKIVSSLAALEYGIVTPDNSLRKWSGEQFWKSDWNRDISLDEAFKASCVWYYRQLINEIGQENMQSFVREMQYGNMDISDWQGRLNKNNTNPSLTGFWVESSLKISPLEQVDILERIFSDSSNYKIESLRTLRMLMETEQEIAPVKIYGKTGYGKLNNVSLDSWFVGMFEGEEEPTYFALHLSESEDPGVSSALAKSIALQIIAEWYSF